MIDFICSACGRHLKATEVQLDMPKFLCMGSQIGTDIGNKIKSLAKSTSNRPSHQMCDNTQIEKRYNICTSCIHFKNNVCSLCGCPLSREKNFVNKLAFKKEQCPEGKWNQEL
jgi:hypothetical protein